MKRLISYLLVILILPCLFLTAGAAEESTILDWENLLSEEDEIALMEGITELKESYGIDVMIVTKDSYDGYTAQQRADDLYDFLGGGEDGVLFLLSLAQREWYISTCGKMIYVLTDYGIQQVGEEAAGYFGSGDYYGGFVSFLEALPYYLDAYERGAPVDGYADYSGSYYHGDGEETVYYETEYSPNFVISLIIGLAVAGIAVAVMKSAMNTKRAQRSASAYMTPGSYHLRTYQDLFLYSNVTKTRRQQNTGSGGSSVHRSSGGRSHGGGGGRF